MEEMPGSFDDFSVEMGDYELKKVKKYDRLWKIGTGGSIDQCPLIFDEKLYFGSLNHNAFCLNALSGELIWKHKVSDRICISSPIENNGIIYVGSYDKNMYAFDSKNGTLVWKFKTEGIINTNAGVMNNILYFGSADRNFYALNAIEGSLKWKFGTMGEVNSEPTFFDNCVLFGSYDRNFYCIEAETGMLTWKLETYNEVQNSGQFAIHEDSIYLTSFDNFLRKVNVKTGQVLWKKKLGQYGQTCATLIHDDLLIVPTEDGIVFGLDFDGNIKWKFTKNKPVGVPVVYNGKVYFTCEDMNLYCISLEGNLIWKFRTQEINWWKPSIWEGRIYFGSYDCHMYCLDAETGKLFWKFRTEGSPSKYPPAYEEFEIEVKIPESEIKEETSEKRYDLASLDEEGATNFYKSRMTYQVSTQYASKGKYQVDSDEEEF